MMWCVIRSRHNRVSIYRNLRTAGYVILQSPPECPQCPTHQSCVWSFGATRSYHAASSGQGARSRLGWGCCVAPSASCLDTVCCCSCSLSMRITKLISRSRSDWSLYGKNPAERWGRKCWRRPDGGYQRMKTLPLLGSGWVSTKYPVSDVGN